MIQARKVSAENIARLEKHLNSMVVFPFSKKAAEAFALLEMQLKHQPIGEKDLMIAAHALSMKATCVTDNTDEFKRVPGLILENWRRAR
jgi:tRNA(fMet)-specific endonuclease VapC